MFKQKSHFGSSALVGIVWSSLARFPIVLMPMAAVAERWLHIVAVVSIGQRSISPCGNPGCKSRSSGCSFAALHWRRLLLPRRLLRAPRGVRDAHLRDRLIALRRAHGGFLRGDELGGLLVGVAPVVPGEPHEHAGGVFHEKLL